MRVEEEDGGGCARELGAGGLQRSESLEARSASGLAPMQPQRKLRARMMRQPSACEAMSRKQIQLVAAAAAATCAEQGAHGYSNMQNICNIQPVGDDAEHAAITSHPHVVDAPGTCLCGNGVKASQVSPCSTAEENMMLESSVQSVIDQQMPAEIGAPTSHEMLNIRPSATSSSLSSRVLLAPSQQIVLQQPDSSIIIDESQIQAKITLGSTGSTGNPWAAYDWTIP
ncbi:hypothetical protein GOP47_0015513 [Adiantum capillus-veneris]|uniref:Uncharacterized protein n=1 Tax=Adiantum capillus-veneris TaxID=13818 RepID=A0A9D4UK54_ADICA|nr:hypothetical protein GOP47_0015513 [Adiantum capillus-veneris]